MTAGLLAGRVGRAAAAVLPGAALGVFHLRAYVRPAQVDDVSRALRERRGARHIVLSGIATDSGATLITAELDDEAADATITDLTALGVGAEDLSIARVEVVRPVTLEGIALELRSSRDTLVWSEVADEAIDNVGLRPSYLAYMVVAGVIAAFGVLEHSAILIVGAMAVSPDLLPLTAAAVALVGRRPMLLGKALGTLLPGLVTTVVTAWVVTRALVMFGVVRTDADIHSGVVYGLAHVFRRHRVRRTGRRRRRHAELREPRELRRRRGHLGHHDPGGGLRRRRRRSRRGGRRRRRRGPRREPRHAAGGGRDPPSSIQMAIERRRHT